MASDVISIKDKYYEVATFGYCRNVEKSFKINIPIIFKTIISKYCKKYIIIGIGYNNYGSLSIGQTIHPKKWTKLIDLENITTNISNIYPNQNALMVIDHKNQLYLSGFNGYNKLGIDENQAYIHNFRQFTSEYKINFVCRGNSNHLHTFIYLINQSLYANGNNEYGNFGNNKQDNNWGIRHILTPIPRFWKNTEQLKQILCYPEGSFFLTSKKNLYFSGKFDGCYDTLKPILIDKNISDILVGNCFYMTLNTSGLLKIGGLHENAHKITKFFNENNKLEIKKMYGGIDFGVILTSNNECYTFGYNTWGQCGNNSTHNEDPILDPYLLKLKDENEFIIKASCGYGHNLLLTSKNNVYSFGFNRYNQCTASVNDECILSPYLLDKEKELKLVYDNFIYSVCDVLAYDDNSIIFIDPCKARKI